MNNTKDNWAVSLTKCALCGGDNNIIINSNLSSSDSAERVRSAHGKVVEGHPPCDECQKMMEMGIMMIGYDPSISKPAKGIEHIYRSGEICVVKESFIENNIELFGKDISEETLKRRFIFVPSEFVKDLIAMDNEHKKRKDEDEEERVEKQGS